MNKLASRLSLALAGVLGALPATADAIEQPEYTVITQHADWEVRRYAPSIEAQVTVVGPWNTAVSDGFRVLAGYIFGDNAPRQKIAMTAPVATQRVPDGQKIAMTAPVAAQPRPSASGAESWVVAFTMPSAWRLDTLPVPEDPRVQLVEVPARDVAAVSFGLWATEARVAAERHRLLDQVRNAGLHPMGEPIVAQYNPPWTPPPFRRNEVLIALGEPIAAAD